MEMVSSFVIWPTCKGTTVAACQGVRACEDKGLVECLLTQKKEKTNSSAMNLDVC